MIRIHIPAAAALAVLIAACSPAPDTAPEAVSPGEAAAPETAASEPAMAETPAPETAAPETAGPDAAALHALLVENADDLVPSDWNTGEPVSETSLVYWMLPALDVEAERSAACTPLSEPAGAQDCTLSFVAPSQEASRPPVEALFRFSVAEGDDGQLILLSPNVRWAVTG